MAWRGRGAKETYQIGEDSAEIFLEHAVFVPDSSEGMTGGSRLSAAEGGARYRFGKEGKRAVGRF
jgi:hypothetical protein